jgi:hypothetical protein
VKDAEEANLGTEMLRITRHLAQCFSDGVEKQAIERCLILQDERVEFVRQREHNVEVTCLKQFLLPGVDPQWQAGLRKIVRMLDEKDDAASAPNSVC